MTFDTENKILTPKRFENALPCSSQFHLNIACTKSTNLQTVKKKSIAHAWLSALRWHFTNKIVFQRKSPSALALQVTAPISMHSTLICIYVLSSFEMRDRNFQLGVLSL